MKRSYFTWILLAVSTLTPFSLLNAEITRPYTIDEKPQVIFGDTVTIGPYRGLENYKADYVGGYLHISYSVTHARFGTASNPALFYVYPEDPRNRAIPNFELLYSVTASPVNNSAAFLTDYYIVDTQFSATGYRQFITEGVNNTLVYDETFSINNIDNNTFVAFANLFPKSPINDNSMAFTPVRLIEDTRIGYSNLKNDSSEQIMSSYNYIVQSLGTNLSGTLTQIDLNTSNPNFLFYGDRPKIDLYECDDDTYEGFATLNQKCTNIFSGTSLFSSQITSSVQPFDVNSVVFNPSKYYFFSTSGNNPNNTLPKYYGSHTDVVDGSCFQYIFSQAKFIPCVDISDLYFKFYGITKNILPVGNSSVLFIPGLESSRLYKNTILNCSINCEDQLWETNGNSDVEDLYLDTNGNSIKPNIYTRDIIDELNTPIPTGPAGQNIYKSFISNMDGLVSSGDIHEWKAFPYDWRKSVEDVVNTPQDLGNGKSVLLIDTLKNLVASSTNGKVTIVAHSNGGLVAKALLKKLEDDKTAGVNNLIDNIDVLILVAVPEIGTAKAVPVVMHGYDSQLLFGWLMDEVRARELGRNMSGAYGLLPSKEYINHVSASPTTFADNLVPSGVTTDMVSKYGSAINSYSEYKDFLFGNEGRKNPSVTETLLPINLSQSLFAQAEALHNDIDNFVPPSTMRVVEVAGWGLNTLASFEYYPRQVGCSGQGVGCNSYVLDERPRFTIDGDKTVVVPSAQYMSFQGNAEKYWIDLSQLTKSRHSTIFEVSSLNNFISSIIKKDTPVFDNILKDSFPSYSGNILRLSIHSPVTMDAYDSQGNHTGKICPPNIDFCYVEENILNSSYLEFGEGKYINLPEDEFSKIILTGTNIGTFTYDSEKVLPDGSSSTLSFVDIPVTTQTLVEISNNTVSGLPELKLDVTGDGVFDFTISPNSKFDPVVYLQIMRETIDSLDLSQGKKNAFGKRVDNLIKLIQKGKIDKAKLKADKFTDTLEKRLEKPDPKKNKPEKLSKTDAQLLLDMLNQLLDNLE